MQRDSQGNWQWNYVVDENAIKDTEKELADKEKDYQKEKDEIAKDSEEARIDAEIERLQDLADQKEEEYNEQVDRYTKFYQDQLQNTIDGLQDIDYATRNGLNNVSTSAQQGLNKMKTVYTNSLQDIYTSVREYCQMMRDELASVGEFTGVDNSNNNSSKEKPKVVTAIQASGIGIARFDTGGYVGDISNNGALAIVDKKERVLTAQQNNNFEKLVGMLGTTSNMGNLNNLVSNTQNSNVTYQLGATFSC